MKRILRILLCAAGWAALVILLFIGVVDVLPIFARALLAPIPAPYGIGEMPMFFWELP